MLRKLEVAPFYVAALICISMFAAADAQIRPGEAAPPVITQRIDERNLITLQGTTRRVVTPETDRGPVHDDFMLDHMLLQLRRSPAQEQALQQFISELHTQGSPNFHRWISAQEFGQRFGLASQDLETISTWLRTHGLKVNFIYASGMVIDFSGTVRQVTQTFHTAFHHIQFNGEQHIANVNDPQVPAALAPAVVGVVSLNDVKPVALHRMHKLSHNYTFSDIYGPTYAMVPQDLATIYNLNPLFNSGLTGQGQTIVLIEDTDIYTAADWTTFRSTFGLSHYSSASLTTIHPGPATGVNNCTAPGVIAPNDAEAILDAEWASAAAPSATLQLAACADTTTTFGGLIALENLINSNTPPPPIMSISYGQCETENGASANAAYNSAYQQAVSEGVSIFVAAGDSGAAGCDNSVSQAKHGIGVNAFASTPYNVAVGGTDFSDTYSGSNNLYWNSTNTSTFASALSYVPEIPWNDSCAGQLVSSYEGYTTPYGASGFCNSDIGAFLQTTVAGGGGPSGCATGSPSIAGVVGGTCAGWPKPSWQSIFGNPNDGVRDTPDVSLFAADGLWSHYFVFCWSDTANGGAACTGAPSGWSGAGGTSFASPIMAGVQALINQKAGVRQGNPNPEYYQLAAAEYSSPGSGCNSSNGNGVSSACIFYDITQGDMDVNCSGPDCYRPSGPTGVLSTSNSAYLPAYGANVGWDFATGIGSINAANLVNNWPSTFGAPALTISKTHVGSFLQGQQQATYTVTVSDNALSGPTNGTVTVAETLPTGLTLVSMSGSGWSCTGNTCTRSDVLISGASYPSITVTVNVGANASSPQVNQVSVSGGGSASASATDSTTIIGPPSAPTSLSAAAFNGQVSLSWNSSASATSYTVLRSTTSGTSYISIAKGLAATAYTDTAVTDGTTYYYVVQAVNAAGTSGNSNQVSATPAILYSWPNGYAFRRAITINHTQVANTDQVNFPVLIAGTYSYLATLANGGCVTNANGYDILFTSDASGNTPL
ncbi:MAG TPA: protease pro-enzyme activation domain-containing protein, partial [Terriglobales bacterium]|nr:protease pro-enzyme activation domain-containing protein [Terriglobales bacterium]